MYDLEEACRRMLEEGLPETLIIARLASMVAEVKPELPLPEARLRAEAILRDVKGMMLSEEKAEGPAKALLDLPRSGVKVSEQGVGCRGLGDMIVHELLAELASSGAATLTARDMDDAGAVRLPDGSFLVVSVDGIHSRLGFYPFLAGFHAARAALRDVAVKGAEPIGLLVDVHVGDDADVSVLLDFEAGVAAAAALAGAPVLAGSTLRIGGDMVLGSRVTGCVGALGVARTLWALRNIKPGDHVVVTEGSGGGTVSTAALCYGRPDVVLETINAKFLEACRAARESKAVIHAALDWTNGGLRGDLYNAATRARVKIRVYEDKVYEALNPKVTGFLKEHDIDPLGVSMDSIVFFTPSPEDLIEALEEAGVKAVDAGVVEEGEPRAVLVKSTGEEVELKPLWREEPYTEIKKIVGTSKPPEDLEERIMKAYVEVKEKAMKVVEEASRKRRM